MTGALEITREKVTRAALDYVLGNLRERDRREILALRWNDDLDAVAESMMCVAGGSLWSAFWARGEPVAVTGATLVRPGVMLLGAFGTDRWPCVVRAVTRDFRDRVRPTALAMGVHRGEAWALAENTDNLRWIESLGGKAEATLHGMGRNGEDFVCLRWMRDP